MTRCALELRWKGMLQFGGFGCKLYMSSDPNPCDIPLYWLANGDPYNGL